MPDQRQAGTGPAGTTCPKCGHDNRPGAKFCSRCATPLATAAGAGGTRGRAAAGGTAACAHCGKPLPPGAAFCPACGTAVAAAGGASAPSDPSLQAALGRLGLSIGGRQIADLILAVVGGMVFARVLPYWYAPILGPILNVIFARLGGRDTFNVFLMAALTFLFSFGIAFTSMAIAARREVA